MAGACAVFATGDAAAETPAALTRPPATTASSADFRVKIRDVMLHAPYWIEETPVWGPSHFAPVSKLSCNLSVGFSSVVCAAPGFKILQPVLCIAFPQRIAHKLNLCLISLTIQFTLDQTVA